MWRRGANFEGDTANFIETEQLLETEDYSFSFLQVLFYINEFLVQLFPFHSFSLQLVLFSTSIFSFLIHITISIFELLVCDLYSN